MRATIKLFLSFTIVFIFVTSNSLGDEKNKTSPQKTQSFISIIKPAYSQKEEISSLEIGHGRIFITTLLDDYMNTMIKYRCEIYDGKKDLAYINLKRFFPKDDKNIFYDQYLTIDGIDKPGEWKINIYINDSLVISKVITGKTKNVPENPTFDFDEIDVPAIFMPTLTWTSYLNDYERFLSSFKQGFWACVEKYKDNIRYKSTEEDKFMNGWGSEISGFKDGYEDAEKMIKENIRLFGYEKTGEYLKDWYDSLWE